MSNWTLAQRAAIDLRGCNLLLSAGAGAGKTAVLVERIIRRILDQNNPVDVDRLLVVTFTNAAAAEMRERVAGALQQELAKQPDNDRLRRQITLLGRATITTLHSFCLEILRQKFYLVGLDPAFRVADATECALMQVDVLETLLEESYTTLDSAFVALVEGFGGRNSDEGLQKIIFELADFALSQPKPEQWLKDASAAVAVNDMADVLQKPWFDGVLRQVRGKLAVARDHLESALAIAEVGPTHYCAVISSELAALESLIAADFTTWNNMREGILNMSFGRLPSKRGYDAPDKDACQNARNAAKESIKDLVGGYLAPSEDEVVASLKLAEPQVAMLTELALDFLARYRAAKQAKGIVDFSDLEHLALAILTDASEDSGVAGELRARFVEVLVDEYQDINAVQETILRAVAAENNMVMVGDVKQSIYRFRLADPNLFRAKEREFASLARGQCLYLADNFRSRPAVIAAINYIFGQLMSASSIGEVDYDARAALVAGAKYPAGENLAPAEVAVCLLERKESDTALADLDANTREARVVAQEIARLVEGACVSVWDNSAQTYRPVHYRDIVVLQRATAGRADVFVDVFAEHNIPSYTDAVGGYFRATEVHVCRSLLKLIDNPRQDIPLAAVLRSPLVGLDASELAEIRLAQSGSYWDAVVASAPHHAKLQLFLTRLENWRDMARRGGLPELIGQIYRETGYYLYVGTLPGGRQRQANLRALLDRAHQFETTAYKGLFRFLRFIERLEEQEGDLGKPSTCGENDDVVRIMSVHKSKGLEFPVVFVAGLGNKFNLRDLSGQVLVHKETGIGPKVVDVEARSVYPTLVHRYLSDVLRRESLSEELRVLYVALTRAREMLYLVGAINKRDEKIAEWRQFGHSGPRLVAPHLMEGAGNYWDWLGPTVFSHAAEVAFARLSETPPLVPAGSQAGTPSQLLAAVTQLGELPDGPYSAEVARRLGYRYPHTESTRVAAKTSVSELKRRRLAEEQEEEAHTAPAVVAFRRSRQQLVQEPGALTAAEIGTAMHMLLQHVDLSAELTEDYFVALKAAMVTKHLLTPREAESFSHLPIAAFFAGDLGQRLLASPRVWRELPFSWRVPAQEVHPNVRDEFVYVQGVIDCLFSEGDALILVDYKSDRVTEDTAQAAGERYRPQIELYARAVESLFKRPVAERYIYFFALGRGMQV